MKKELTYLFTIVYDYYGKEKGIVKRYVMLKKENTPEIETDRLRFRKVIDQDASALIAIFKVDGTYRYRPWFPLASMVEAKNYIKKRIYPVYEKEVGYFYAIERKETNNIIGFLSIVGIDECLCKGEIEYGFLEDYWTGGYAQEAGIALLEKAKENGFSSISVSQNTMVPMCGRLMELMGMSYRYSIQMRKPGNVMTTYRYYQIDFD